MANNDIWDPRILALIEQGLKLKAGAVLGAIGGRLLVRRAPRKREPVLEGSAPLQFSRAGQLATGFF